MTAKTWLPSYAGRQVSRRKFLGGAAAGVGAAALIACGGSGGSSTPQVITVDPSGVRKPGAVVFAKDYYKLADETKEAVAGGVFTQVQSADLTESQDPYLASQGQGDRWTDIGYEYLVMRNAGPGVDPASPEASKMLPDLASAVEVANDGMSYTFTMRDGVKFHNIAPVNGRVMTIDDWKASLDRYSAVSANKASWDQNVDHVEFPDAKHMVVKMKAPYGPYLLRMYDYNYAWKIVPKELATNPDLLAQKMIGTNFRMVESFNPSISWNFKRHDDYWQGKAFIDKWIRPIITEDAQQYAQFKAQNVESYSPTAQNVLTVRKDVPDAMMVGGAIAIETVNRANFGHIEAETSPWKDPRVRIGLHKLVDWNAFLEFQSNHAAFTAAGIEPVLGYTSHVPYDLSYFLDPRKQELGDASSNYFYDPAAAKAMIQAAGFSNGFDIDYWDRNTASSLDLIQYHLDSWKKSGVVNPIQHDITAQDYADRIVATANFKGIQYPSSSSGSDVDYLLYRNYHTGGPPNPWTDLALDKIVEAQETTLDPAKRIDAIKDFQKYVAKTFPLEPGNHRYSTWSFQWLWLHNISHPQQNRSWTAGYQEWLDANMPHRNG